MRKFCFTSTIKVNRSLMRVMMNQPEFNQPFIPRTLRMALETPEDYFDDVPAALDRPTAKGETEGPIFFDFKWTAFPNPPIRPELRREKFSDSNVGPTTPCVDPYDTFIAIWDTHEQLVEHIALETNRYAQEVAHQMLLNHDLHPNSLICEWQERNVDEIYTYLAILLAMGIVVKSRVVEYWSATTDVFCTPGFSVHMLLRRFQLTKCIHIAHR